MIYSIYQLREKSIPLPITSAARKIAESAASEQLTTSRKRQVYLNILAVSVVNNYMQMMGIPTELRASDSWNKAVRLCFDVADLKLANLGHIECRPISPGSLTEPITSLFDFPADMPDDRIGCIVVELDTVQDEASLLGFAKEISSGQSLSIAQLFEMDDFGEYFEELSNQRIEQPKKVVNLQQWLQNLFEPGWHPLEKFSSIVSDDLVPSFRNVSSDIFLANKQRGKLIELGGKGTVQSIALVVEIIPPGAGLEFDVNVKIVHLRGVLPYLPPQLYISILDTDKVEVMGTYPRGENGSIRLPFKCESGERFSVKLVLGDVNVTEEFVI